MMWPFKKSESDPRKITSSGKYVAKKNDKKTLLPRPRPKLRPRLCSRKLDVEFVADVKKVLASQQKLERSIMSIEDLQPGKMVDVGDHMGHVEGRQEIQEGVASRGSIKLRGSKVLKTYYETVSVTQWFLHGDHPLIDPFGSCMYIEAREPQFCKQCNRHFSAHGWAPDPIFDAAKFRICPGDWIATTGDGKCYRVQFDNGGQ